MKKNVQGMIFIVLFVAFAALSIVLLALGQVGYMILSFCVAIVCLIAGIGLVSGNTTPEKVYEKKIKSILNTYDSILVKSNTVPNFEDRNIINLMNIDDLIDAQLEIRKPICYMKQTETCSFALLDDKEAYVYVEKLHDDLVSPMEIEIKNMKIKKKKEKDMDSEILKDIEKTTIVKLSNMKSYKISPVRKKKKYQTEILEWLDDDFANDKSEDKSEKLEKKMESLAKKKEVDVL